MLRQLGRSLAWAADKARLSLQVRAMTNGGGQKLAGKVAIVTASTEGIGYAIARRLAADGAKVMLSSRKANNVDEAVQQLRNDDLQVSGVVCHVARREDRAILIEETLKQYGGIDILVSNAAANPYFGSLLETPEEAWDKIFDTNVKATFLLCRDVVPHLEERGNGSIVMVSSIGGFMPMANLGAYCVSKTALLGLTKALAPELAPRNIRVNCLAPGLIKTKFSKALWSNEAASDMALQQIPMDRLGTPEECAGAVSFMVSDDAAYMTGETILLTGGMPSRL